MKSKAWFVRGCVILGLAGLLANAVNANPPFNESTGVQNTNANPSPDAALSNIGNYINISFKFLIGKAWELKFVSLSFFYCI